MKCFTVINQFLDRYESHFFFKLEVDHWMQTLDSKNMGSNIGNVALIVTYVICRCFSNSQSVNAFKYEEF